MYGKLSPATGTLIMNDIGLYALVILDAQRRAKAECIAKFPPKGDNTADDIHLVSMGTTDDEMKLGFTFYLGSERDHCADFQVDVDPGDKLISLCEMARDVESRLAALYAVHTADAWGR